MCSIEGCELEEYENGKCILHCSKKDIKNENNVIKKFWKEVRNKLIEKEEINLKGLRIPSFEKIQLDSNGLLKENSNFLRKGESNIVSKNINFTNSIFYSDIDFKGLIFNKMLNFDNSITTEYLKFENLNCSDISFINAHFKNFLLFDIKCSNISFNKSTFEKSIRISKLNIEKQFDFSQINFKEFSHVKLIEIKTNDFRISDIFNDAKSISILDMKIKKNFILHYSDLNNFVFNNINLENSDLSFYEISVRNTTFSGVKWGNINKKEFEYKNRSVLREIKHALDSQGDIIEANKFYALEMKEREKELSWKNDFFEKLVFSFHGITSNHSQNWILALFWIIISSFGYTLLSNYCFSDNDFIYGTWIVISIILAIGIGFFLKDYIDDTLTHTSMMLVIVVLFYLAYGFILDDFKLYHFSSNVNPFSVFNQDGKLGFLELIYRITIAYLIYQLIISIRQNTRRK